MIALSVVALVAFTSADDEPRYMLSRAEDYTSSSTTNHTILHYDLWWIGALDADKIFQRIKSNSQKGYLASIGIGINHPPSDINTKAQYYNSWGEQALQQQVTANGDGTGVNYVFHPEIWPRLDNYLQELRSVMFDKHKIPEKSVTIIRIGMDKTGEFNYPYSELAGGGNTNNSWWAFAEKGAPFSDYPASLLGWKPRKANTAGGNESAAFVDYYYQKLAAFQNFMVGITQKSFPLAYPAVLYPGSSPRIQPADVQAAVQALGRGEVQVLGQGKGCVHGDCPQPISAGWARCLLVPSLATASAPDAIRPLAWHTGCEQIQASGPVFDLAKQHGLRVGCENSGGIFDHLQGKAYEDAVENFFLWTLQHNTAVTFLITNQSFYSSVPEFLSCEEGQLAKGELNVTCFERFCSRCQ